MTKHEPQTSEATIATPESTKSSEPKSPLESLKAWAVGLTGVLVVLPALVNSGYDVYATLAKIPKTETQKINDELFRKYFNKQPVLAFPIPVKRDAGMVDVNFSVFEGGDIYIEFGKRSQWFQFPLLEKTSFEQEISIIGSAVAAVDPPLDGLGRFEQKDHLEGSKIIRERRWDNGVLEVLTLDPRTGNIIDRKTRNWAGPEIGPSGATPSQAAWLLAVKSEKVGSIRFQRFADAYYVMVAPLDWRPSSIDSKIPAVKVPRGFVTSMESVPTVFWSIIRPDGAFAYAAVIHDYLYWEQFTSRETADEVFKAVLLELDVPKSQVDAIYLSTRSFGERAWSQNSALKRSGEKRVLARFPSDPSVTWEVWKTRPNVFR